MLKVNVHEIVHNLALLLDLELESRGGYYGSLFTAHLARLGAVGGAGRGRHVHRGRGRGLGGGRGLGLCSSITAGVGHNMILPCHRWQSRRSWVYLKLWLKAYISLGENNEGEFQSVTKFVVYGHAVMWWLGKYFISVSACVLLC